MAISSTVRPAAPAIGHYAAQVRAALRDLSAYDRDELAGDLESHLAETAEAGPVTYLSLTDRLGLPQEYAAGLREAAGFPPAAAPAASGRPDLAASGSGARAMTYWLRGLAAATALGVLGVLLGLELPTLLLWLAIPCWLLTPLVACFGVGAVPGTRRYAAAFHRLPDVAAARAAKAAVLAGPGGRALARLGNVLAWVWWCLRGLAAAIAGTLLASATLHGLVRGQGDGGLDRWVPDVWSWLTSAGLRTGLAPGDVALVLLFGVLLVHVGVLSVLVGLGARRHPFWRLASIAGTVVAVLVFGFLLSWF